MNDELPAETDENRQDSEYHQHTMAGISEIVSQNPELFVTHQHEEQNQTNRRSNQQQKSKEQSLRSTNAVNTSGVGLGEGDSASRQHHLQSVLEIFILREFGVTADVFPHHEDDSGANQRVLNDEWIQVWCRVLNDCAHDVDTLAAGGVEVERRNCRQISVESFSMWEIELVCQILEFMVNVRRWVRSEVSDVADFVRHRLNETAKETSCSCCGFIFFGVAKLENWPRCRRGGCGGGSCCGVNDGVFEAVETRVEGVDSNVKEASGGC